MQIQKYKVFNSKDRLKKIKKINSRELSTDECNYK